jgi:N-acetylmuramate 1-kinase
MTDRNLSRVSFLAEAGWGGAEIQLMPGDFSARRYARLVRPGETRILMDDPTGQVEAFLRAGGILAGLGASVPQIFAVNVAAGFVLMEDFGDLRFSDRLIGGADPLPLYRRATDVLINLAWQWKGEGAPQLPRFDVARFADQVMLFVDQYIPYRSGVAVRDAARADFRAAWEQVLPQAFNIPDGLLLRDYHPDNLMDLPSRPGFASCGLLDFQDMGVGPVAYDLVSLLEDARRDVPSDLADEMIRIYLTACPAVDAAAFKIAYDILGAQRHARILGILAKKPDKHIFLPRVLAQFQAKLQKPALSPVATWIRAHAPGMEETR